MAQSNINLETARDLRELLGRQVEDTLEQVAVDEAARALALALGRERAVPVVVHAAHAAARLRSPLLQLLPTIHSKCLSELELELRYNTVYSHITVSRRNQTYKKGIVEFGGLNGGNHADAASDRPVKDRALQWKCGLSRARALHYQ